MPARFKDLAMDANDHQALADWWCRALGYVRRVAATEESHPREWPVPIWDPHGYGPLIWVNPVTEKKIVKNRMHMDILGDSDELIAMGATLLHRRDDITDWDVLADPEGNEFCVFPPR